MSMIKTDLALESHEIAKNAGIVDGVVSEETKNGNITVTNVKVLNENGVKAIGKPVGTYVSVEATGLFEAGDIVYEDALSTVANELVSMLSNVKEGLILVAGLGNALMTPDALGPRTVENILVTRHIAGELSKIEGLEGMRPVAAIAPGVLGQTGVETGEIIYALVQKIKPAAVIVVDALSSRRASRLGNTIQLSDTGIIPGSGVGNSRFAINSDTLGVPVFSIGVPTVVDAATLVIDVLEGAGIPANQTDEQKIKSSIEPGGLTMFVTPRLVDLVIEHAAKLTGMAINRALHPTISTTDLAMLVN